MSTTLCSHYSVLLNARGRLKMKTMGVGAELCCASNAPLLVFPLPVNSPSQLSPVDSLPVAHSHKILMVVVAIS